MQIHLRNLQKMPSDPNQKKTWDYVGNTTWLILFLTIVMTLGGLHPAVNTVKFLILYVAILIGLINIPSLLTTILRLIKGGFNKGVGLSLLFLILRLVASYFVLTFILGRYSI